jgi:hypothetical protein
MRLLDYIFLISLDFVNLALGAVLDSNSSLELSFLSFLILNSGIVIRG